MNQLRSPFRVLFASLLLASMAMTQQLSLNKSGVLFAGETVRVTYSDASRAGETVTITIGNGEAAPFGEEIEIDVVLDANGEGTATWQVSDNWDVAEFAAPDAPSITRGISAPLAWSPVSTGRASRSVR